MEQLSTSQDFKNGKDGIGLDSYLNTVVIKISAGRHPRNSMLIPNHLVVLVCTDLHSSENRIPSEIMSNESQDDNIVVESSFYWICFPR